MPRFLSPRRTPQPQNSPPGYHERTDTPSPLSLYLTTACLIKNAKHEHEDLVRLDNDESFPLNGSGSSSITKHTSLAQDSSVLLWAGKVSRWRLEQAEETLRRLGVLGLFGISAEEALAELPEMVVYTYRCLPVTRDTTFQSKQLHDHGLDQ